MARKSYKPEEIIKLLRVVEIEAGKGQTTGLACKTLGHPPQYATSGLCDARG